MPNGECSPDKRMERNGCERIGKRTQSACTGNFTGGLIILGETFRGNRNNSNFRELTCVKCSSRLGNNLPPEILRYTQYQTTGQGRGALNCLML